MPVTESDRSWMACCTNSLFDSDVLMFRQIQLITAAVGCLLSTGCYCGPGLVSGNMFEAFGAGLANQLNSPFLGGNHCYYPRGPMTSGTISGHCLPPQMCDAGCCYAYPPEMSHSCCTADWYSDTGIPDTVGAGVLQQYQPRQQLQHHQPGLEVPPVPVPDVPSVER